jgi:hypothetical protein
LAPHSATYAPFDCSATIPQGRCGVRPLFYLITVAAVVMIVLLARVKPGDPAVTRTFTEPPDPPPEPATATTSAPPADGDQVARLTRRLAASEKARRRERRAYHRRLRAVIHSTVLPGHWLERSFLCIHAGEGAWGAATGNGYYGGLQMDLSFQRSYGGWALRVFGTANRWPASVQVATAIRAYTAGRGFYPWPNTARACGLIR